MMSATVSIDLPDGSGQLVSVSSSVDMMSMCWWSRLRICAARLFSVAWTARNVESRRANAGSASWSSSVSEKSVASHETRTTSPRGVSSATVPLSLVAANDMMSWLSRPSAHGTHCALGCGEA